MKKQQIDGETLVTKSKDESLGTSQAQAIEVAANNESKKKIAAKMFDIMGIRSATIDTVGQGEGAVAKVMNMRRKYEHLNAKTDVIRSFRENQNLRIFGDNNDNTISQMAAYNVSNLKKHN